MKRLFNFCKNLNRDAATDSARNVLMAVGLGTVLADLSTTPPLYLCFGVSAALLVWYVDYLRHF